MASEPFRIHVIANTTAALHCAHPSLLDRMRRVAADKAEIHPTSSLAELDTVAARIADQASNLVVLSGGDGSFMAGVTALCRAYGDRRLPWLALLPAGTVATVARNWGMKGDPVSLLERIVVCGSKLKPVTRPTLRVTSSVRGEVEERTGFIFGTGLVARFFDVYYGGEGRGYGAAASIVARVFVESFWNGPYARRVLDPLPCTLELDGRPLSPTAWSLVCAAVVPNLGLHMKVTYRAAEDLARPHVVASALPARLLGPRAPRVLRGVSIGGRDHVDTLSERLTVRFSSDTGPFVLDGEILHAEVVSVMAGPTIDVVTLPSKVGHPS